MKLQDDVLIGSVLVALAIVVLVWVIPGQIPESMEKTAIPPSLMANLCMYIVLCLSILLIIKGLRRPQRKAQSLFTRKNAQRMLFVCVSLGVSGFLIHYLGFFFGGLTVVAGYMLKMGERQPATLLSIAGGAAGICYLAIRFAH